MSVGRVLLLKDALSLLGEVPSNSGRLFSPSMSAHQVADHASCLQSAVILSRLRPSIYLPSIVFIWVKFFPLSTSAAQHCLIGIFLGRHCCMCRSGPQPEGFDCSQSHPGLDRVWLLPCVLTLASFRIALELISIASTAGVLFLISSWYRKNELSKRTALLYCAAILSGAFGGLLVRDHQSKSNLLFRERLISRGRLAQSLRVWRAPTVSRAGVGCSLCVSITSFNALQARRV